MSSEPEKLTEKAPVEVPEKKEETKDAVEDVPASKPEPVAEPQGGDENYLDDSPFSSQAKKEPNTSGKAGVKTTAKPEAVASTGEKRQRR